MRNEAVALRCEGLVKTYHTATGEVRALRGITMTFRRGIMTAVIGPSGSGKSSLLRLLCGLDVPTSGAIHVGPTPLHRASPRRVRALRRRTVGYVFQRPSDNFLPYLTVGEHLFRAARGAPAGAPTPDAVLGRLEIGHRVDHLPRDLSGGEQQRAAIAQVLVSGADIVVADEPTAELDEASDRALLEVLDGLQGPTLILASHDPSVWRRAGEVVELEHGRLRKEEGRHRAGDAAARRSPVPARDVSPVPTLVELRGVSKSYHLGESTVHAVQEATLSVRESEVVALVGRSGSGKTTLLNLIAGWEEPDDGTISWTIPPAAVPIPWNDVAMVPQHLGLVDELTVRENIEYPARLSGRLEDVTDRADALLDGLGLASMEDRLPRETSVGEQQRTALARALVLSPRLVLADEPTGHQDEGWGKVMFAAMRAAAAGGTTCVLATHDLEVIRHSDRVIAMADGRVGEG